VVDDNSTDGSKEIIQNYQTRFEHFVFEDHIQNLGAAVTRNDGLANAHGRYVAFIDSDDVWLPGKIELELNVAKSKNCPFVFSAIQTINEEGDILKKKRRILKKVNYWKLLHNTTISTSTVLVDRRFFGDFRMPLMRSGQDYATWLMLLRGGAVAIGIDKVLAKYRVRSKSLSRNKFDSMRQIYQIQTKFEGIPKFFALLHVFSFATHAILKRIF
jgi:teichuronic acid biosynthesis glycosyltransferase TuaG